MEGIREVGAISPELGFTGLVSAQAKTTVELRKVIEGSLDRVRSKPKNMERGFQSLHDGEIILFTTPWRIGFASSFSQAQVESHITMKIFQGSNG